MSDMHGCVRTSPPQGCATRRNSAALVTAHGTPRRGPLLLCALLLLAVAAGCNPFAPELDEDDADASSLIADQSTVDGVFRNMQYAYTFKDTTMYGGLLHPDFVFIYRDYDKMIDVHWGRDEDMRITSRLFDNAMDLNLVWNNIVGSSGDSLAATITRSFNLTVTFNPSDVVRVDGRVALELHRSAGTEPWRITQWRDESNY
jgi:hypothetical protein